MITCPNCTHNNREGSLYCETCGENLVKKEMTVPAATRKLEAYSNDPVARATWGTARFGEDAIITVRVRDFSEPIVLKTAKQTIIGRYDAVNPRQPDLDLTAYGALEKGVSRIHASISRSEDTLMLTDMGSANGTHLNGQRLIPHQPRLLRDGDEIRLGKLIVHIYFR